jgi:hypothetical protein
MATSLAEIRAKLLEQEQKAQGKSNNQGSGDNTVYPFWNIAEGSSATLRFLPDADESNIYFWKERQMIRIPFSGIKGQDEHKQVTVTVPCVEMWGDSCPIHAEIRPWFKDPSLEDTARKYWKKRSYIFQGFVVDGPAGVDDNPPENPVRRFIINPSIFNIIKAALMDPDFPEIPTDYEQGTDFKLTKTQKGQYADYSTSNWARRERGLADAERQAVETHGLFDLNEFMPKQPGTEELNAIFEMFEASVEGQAYDVDRWGTYYRPWGVEAPAGARPQAAAPVAPAPVQAAAPAPAAPAVSDTGWQEPAAAPAAAPAAEADKGSAADILAAIRARKTS